MEDEERQKKLEAGKAKLAEYRQRKAHADSQKKQKKKKKKKSSEDSEGDLLGRVAGEPDLSVGGEELLGGGRDESQKGNKELPTTEFTFTKTLKSGETVRHDQTYKIEPESELSTTAEDYSSEVNGCHDEMTENLIMSPEDFIWEEVESLQQITEGHTMQEMDALTATAQTVEELSGEVEEIRSAEGLQQLQDFKAALKQRDGIITQLTSNLQQAREERDEIMKEFLALTEQSQKLQIQFQQLQADEAMRSTSRSSAAADLLQARQQIVQFQQQLEEMNVEVRKHQESSSGQLDHIKQLQLKLNDAEMSGRRSEESFTQRTNKKDSLIAEQKQIILSQEQALRAAEEAFAQTMRDKNQLISDQSVIIAEHERSLNLLREELVLTGRTADDNIMQRSDDKDLIIAEKEGLVSERDRFIVQLQDKLETSEKHLKELQQQLAAKESELENFLEELESSKSHLVRCKGEMESCKLQLEEEQMELASCKSELAASRQKERMSSNEIMQLMGTVEDLQKRCHQGSVSESDAVQKVQEEAVRKLELLRAELDELYGQQIVQMKQELNLQHAARVQQMTEQHQAEVKLLKTQQSSFGSAGEVEALSVRIKKLQGTLEQSQAMNDKTKHELNHVIQEKLKLQEKVEYLLRELSAAKEEAERVSTSLVSQERNRDELLHLQETINALRNELSEAREAAREEEAKHESEITNYKIKLEMLEREKDAVLDRMAESQEAELERLRTQLLFSHEEELTNLKEELQRENFLNTENLLNEAAVRHQKALDELGVSYAEQLGMMQTEKAAFAMERDELLNQTLGLKEDLKLALQSSRADELVLQLQEVQAELEELRKGTQEQAKMQNEIQSLLKKTEELENQTKDKEHCWEEKLKERDVEKEALVESSNTLKEEMKSKNLKIETLTAECNRTQQQVAELREEIEKQRTTFSFAEKNFEVNYRELKEEYTCLSQAKTQLEDRARRETLEFEARIAHLQSQIQKYEERSRDVRMEEEKTEDEAEMHKDAVELTEKLHVPLREERSLDERLSEVTGQLKFTESKVGQLERELLQVRQENMEFVAENKSLREEKKQQVRSEGAGEKVSRHQRQIQSLQEEIETLQCRLHAAEAERDGVQHTLELLRLSQTPSPAAGLSSGEGPVDGRFSPRKSAASGSGRRKRRQRSKQERKAGGALPDSREEKQKGEEEGAGSAAEEETLPQMQSQVVSCSPERAGKADSADGYQGDGGSGETVSRQGMGFHAGRAVCQRAEEKEEPPEHGEFRLQMEAQRISLSQIHAAQLELLQEEADSCTRSLEVKLQDLRDRSHRDEQNIFKYQSVMEAVSEECSEIVRSFQKILGKEFLESVDAAGPSVISAEREAASESVSVVLEAKELYGNLQQVRERIEQEHHRLSQLQALLRADGNRITELQTAYDELKTSSEKQISDLQLQLDTMNTSVPDVQEQAGVSASPSVDLLTLRAEAQEKQRQLEESHQQDMERLRAHYQHQAAETEERYSTELFILQQRLQEVAGQKTYYSLSSGPESLSEAMEEELKDLSEGGVESPLPPSPSGLTAQLQALKKALFHKYAQEVGALREQHSSELRRLREEREQERRLEHQKDGGKRKLDHNSDFGAENSSGSFAVSRSLHMEEDHQERVEEEVAKAIVQMSVEFAQQTELARIDKRARQTSTSMQTHLNEDQTGYGELEEQTPRTSPTAGAGPEEEERRRLERELEQKNAEIRKLKEKLQKSEPEQALRRDDEGGQLGEGDDAQLETLTGGPRLTLQDGDLSEKDTERSLLRRANKKLSQVLVDVLKTTAAAEKTLGLHMQSLHDSSAGLQLPPFAVQTDNSEQQKRYSAESYQSSETSADSASIRAGELEADEGLEMSQHLMDSRLLSAELQLQNEEYFMGVSNRLQTALEKMLMAITDSTNQLEHARMTQTELMRESFRHNQEISELLQKQEELQDRLSEEAQAREQLALELHRAEGLIDGYTGERAVLDDQLRQKEELQLSLEQELQVTSSRLHELEQERLQMLEERELLSRQQDAMREEAGPRELCLVEAAMVAAPEADLLEQTEKLMKEKVDVQRQAEKENSDLWKQVKLLEAELEEQVSRGIELEHAQKMESGDLRQQIQALEKQLDKNRKFLDEQAVDREHERDFFQQEIQKLEQQLKSPQKLQIGSERRNQEVEQLTSQLKEKADWCSELLLGSEQLRRELGERDEEIEKLESRIRELEQALLASAESLEKVEQQTQHESITQAKQSTLEAQLQTEREALERKEKEICNLEEQLEQFREELENKSEEVQQLHMQLEIQRKEISSQQQFLETRDGMLQVMEEKDREIALLNEQITKLQHMETASDNKENDEREELIKDLESQVECLRSEQDRVKRSKEEELDQLNEVIEKLQQELANIEQKPAAEEEEDAEGSTWGPTREEFSEMKQKMDQASGELEALRSEHGKLLETYFRLKQSAEALAETENVDGSESELEEALREKTAGLVVLQAEVQALEQSAASRVEELDLRIQELEELVKEKDSEVKRCRLLVEENQSYADDLQQRVSDLEENLREKVAAVLVSQATLEAFQQQQQESEASKQELQRLPAPLVSSFGDFGIPQIDFSGISRAKPSPTGKVVHLTQKLRDLEVGLMEMQKDQELQQQLLSSSEEEVLDYERRLAVLVDLLSQMKAGPHRRASSSVEISSSEQPPVSQLLQELQEVKDETAATKQQLKTSKESCSRLEQELQEKTRAMEKLQLHMAEEATTSELEGKLMEAQKETASTKEELSSCKESLEKLQELLQEREMTIAHLKGEIFQVKAAENGADRTELLQELEKVKQEAVSTKEEVSSYREENKKLQEDLRARDGLILKVEEELQEMRNSVDTTKEELNEYKQQNEQLQENLLARESSIFNLEEQLLEVRSIMDTTKEELNNYKQQNEKLLQDLHNRELSISKLNEELQEIQKASVKPPESVPPSPSPSLSPSPSPQPLSSASSTSQPKRKGGKQTAAKGSTSKEKSPLSRKTSSSRVSSASDQRRASATDSFMQTEPLQTSNLSPESKPTTKEEIEEVIGKFQEKIAQMRELHAAEILDMEARQISESENLRRDNQTLEDENKTLKAVLEKLCPTEAPPSRHDRPASQFKDGYTSDSSSDYSQRTGCDVPSLQQEFRTTPEGARRDADDPLPDRIKMLLREVHQEGMQVLSLSELPISEGEPGNQFSVEGWVKERDALLATVESLKGLITQMQTSGGTDWRAELLDAVRRVFVAERSVLKRALYSQLDLLDTSDAVVHLNQLERRLAEQDAQHREAMGSLHAAERSSLVSEVHQLRAQLEHLHQGTQPGLPLTGECSTKEQREGGGADGAAEAIQLLVEELKVELSQTKWELETTLKAQHKHLKELDTLRVEVTQKAAEVDALNDQLMEERKRSRELQWAVEKERCQSGKSEENQREELEDLQLTVEEQKALVTQLTQTLEQERHASSELSQKAEQDHLSLQSRLQELQVQLETERAKAAEVSSALGRERELRRVVSPDSGPSREEESLLERLQKELDDKHAQVVDLLCKVEAQRLELVRKEEELMLTNQRSRRDHEELLEARVQLETLKARVSEVLQQLEREVERRSSLEEEKERLEERLKLLEWQESGAPQQSIWSSKSTDRTKDWVLQQKSGSAQSASAPPHMNISPTSLTGGPHHGPWRTADRIVEKLHLISSKVCSMASKATGSPTAEVDSGELTWMQSSVDEVITMLLQSPGLPSVPESACLLAGGSSNTLTERLLRQNAELTGFVSRLTEEKNDLRNHTLHLEEELRRYRKAGLGSGDGFFRRGGSKTDSASDLILSQEREAWTREKLRLEKALHLAQSQVARLGAEIRSETLREITGPEADNSALKRMYGKYLRSESFRKALVYQKKYLLLLLGGFQECEEATLLLLSRMGGRPSLSSLESYNQRRRGLMRFRSAVRVSIALSRMRFLVKRWHKATGISSTASCSVNKNGAGLEVRDSPYLRPSSVEMFRETGGGSGGGGGGVSSSRGRSGRESPRSGVSSTPHRYHMVADHGPLTCSHLQSYDPDRALTDYISRLEALQRRLGSVTSGASSYAQLHFGLRR
nr:A-kinase anchor protein 9 isoform X3 [Nothobranchius furzeri]